MRGPARIALFALACLAASRAPAEQVDCGVSYVALETVYLDAGTGAGLAAGDTLSLLRGGERIGSLRVLHAALHSASCAVLESVRTPAAGDRAIGELLRRPDPAPETAAAPPRRRRTPPTASASHARGPSRNGSGNLSLSWTGYRDSGGPQGYDQPELRGGWRAGDLWGGGWSFAFRGRLRGSLRASAPAIGIAADEWRTRVSRLSLEYGGKERATSLSCGRILLAGLPGAGAIDGLRVGRRVSSSSEVGIFAGSRPDWERGDSTPSGLKLGAYWQRLAAPGAPWAALALVDERRAGETSREYLAVASRFSPGGRLRLRQSGEVDWNRGWRADSGEPTIALSNLQLDARYPLRADLDLGLHYDGRRPYRSYYNRSLADSLFDDALRQGLRGRIAFRASRRTRLRANVGLRASTGGDGSAWSWGLGASHRNLRELGFDIDLSLSAFRNPSADGWSPTLRLSRSELSMSYGLYSLTPAKLEARRTQWLRFDAGRMLPGRNRLGVQLEQRWGDDGDGQRFRFDLGHRF